MAIDVISTVRGRVVAGRESRCDGPPAPPGVSRPADRVLRTSGLRRPSPTRRPNAIAPRRLAPAHAADHFGFDLAGNRLKKTTTGNGAGTWAYTYSDRDELHTDVETGANAHAYTYAYDANGSQTLKTGDGSDQLYTWDLRNRMSAATANGTTTAYSYDSASQRVSEQVGTGDVRRLLQDRNNPTGYPQTLEERLGATLDRSYRLGLSVLGQADATGTFAFVRDAHGSDRTLGH